MSIVAAMIIQHIPDRPILWCSWILMVLASQYYRKRRLINLPLETDRPIEVRSREAIRVNLLCSLVLALSFIAFPMFTPFEAALQTMLFLAMGVGTVLVVLGWPPYVFAHIWLGLVPLFVLWAWSGIAGPAGGYGLALSAIGFAYTYSIWRYGQRLYAVQTEFYENRNALADALHTAEQSDAAKTRFLAAASHDLRQPIHALSLLTSTLRLQPLEERTQAIASRIEDSVSALSNQLDALLDLSKLDAGIVKSNNERVYLRQLLDRLFEDMRDQAYRAGIVMEVVCPEDAIASTDARLLESILRNLMTNTIRHNTECRLRLEVSPRDKGWILVVADSGQGISTEEQLHVFEEFYQGNNPERDRSKGLGLGLSIVKRLAKLLSLDMQFSSTPGEGTRFEFSLPARATNETQHTLPDVPKIDLSGLRVLVLDDEDSVRSAMKELLEILGCTVEVASDISTSLDLARSRPIDLALIDYRLRGDQNGLDAVRQLRDIEPDLAAIIISGDTAPQRLREVIAADLLLLSKPVNEAALRQGIAQALSGY